MDSSEVGVILVDHGSRRAESNELLHAVADLFTANSQYAIVEPAHMELAAPSITEAFDRCVERGARLVVIHPYFLGPGRHWAEDIPALAAAAAAKHPGVARLVTAPLGIDVRLVQVAEDRINHCLQHAQQEGRDCDLCRGTDKCELRRADDDPPPI